MLKLKLVCKACKCTSSFYRVKICTLKVFYDSKLKFLLRRIAETNDNWNLCKSCKT